MMDLLYVAIQQEMASWLITGLSEEQEKKEEQQKERDEEPPRKNKKVVRGWSPEVSELWDGMPSKLKTDCLYVSCK